MKPSPVDNAVSWALKQANAHRVPARWWDSERNHVITDTRATVSFDAWMDTWARPDSPLRPEDAFFLYWVTPLPGTVEPRKLVFPDSLPAAAESRAPFRLDSLEHRFEAWRSLQQRTFTQQSEEVAGLIRRQAQLEKVPPLPSGPFVQEHAVVRLPARFKDVTELADGLDVFNRARVTDLVPFVQWRPITRQTTIASEDIPEEEDTEDASEESIKRALAKLAVGSGTVPTTAETVAPVKVFQGVVEGRTSFDTPGYERLNAALPWSALMAEQERVDESALFFSVFNAEYGEVDPEARDVALKTKEAYSVGSLTIDDHLTGAVSLRVTPSNMNRVLQRIESVLPPVEFDSNAMTATRITGDVTFYGGTLDVPAFLFLIAADPLFHSLFFVKESSYVQEDKRRLTLHFRGTKAQGSMLTATINPGVVQTEETIRLASGELTRVPAKTPLLQVRIGKSSDKTILNQFIQVFSRAIRLVAHRGPAVHALLDSIFGMPASRKGVGVEKASSSSKRGEDRLRINELQKAAPDVFVAGYARKCQKHKPKPLSETEAAEWKGDVMVFPNPSAPMQPRNGPLRLVCDHPDAPFPGVSPSDLPNRREFPYLPCCFTSNQNVPGKHTYAYLHGVERTTRTEGRTHVMVGQKRLSPGQLGAVEREITQLVGSPVFRMGCVEDGLNSALHALLVSIEDTTYANLSSAAQRRDHVARLRAEWFAAVDPSWVAQERVDLPLTLEPDEAIDTWTWCRVLEERGGVNLFVLTEDEKQFQIPRHVDVLCKPLNRTRPTVVWVQKRGVHENRWVPSYEVLTRVSESGKPIRGGTLFDVGERLVGALFQTHQRRVWDPLAETFVPFTNVSDPEITTLLPHDTLSEQAIDSTGHARAFRTRNDNMVYETWPTRAIAGVPVRPATHPSWSEHARPSVERIIEKHGLPNEIDVWEGSGSGAGGTLIGVWYRLGQRLQSVYVACQPTHPIPAFLAGVPLGPPGALQSVSMVQDRIGDLRTAKKTLLLLSQWVGWVWSHRAPDTSAAAFLESVGADVYEDTSEESGSLVFYEPLPIQRKWARKDIVAFAARHWPSAFTPKGKIRFPSASFRHRFAEFLQRVRDVQGSGYFTSSDTVRGVFQTAFDFTPRPFTRVFTDTSDFVHWFAEQQRVLFARTVLDSQGRGLVASLDGDPMPVFPGRLDPTLLHSTPFPLVVSNLPPAVGADTALIQNVVGGERDRALAVCLGWHDTGLNTGYRTPALEGDPPVWSELELGPDGSVVVPSGSGGGGNPGVWLLRTTKQGRPFYSAVLPLASM